MSMKHEIRVLLLAAAILAGMVLHHGDPVELAGVLLFGPEAS
jgi:hypothetical protein